MKLLNDDQQAYWGVVFRLLVPCALIVALLAVLSCAPAKSYRLDQIPTYDMAAANREYQPLRMAQNRFAMTAMAVNRFIQSGSLVLTDSDKRELDGLVDVYLWWISAAHIQLFNGEYTKAKESAAKADKTIEQMEAVIVKALKRGSL